MSNIKEYIESCLAPVDMDSITTVQTRECRSFSELIERFKEDMTITKSIEECLAICCAAHIAVKLDGDPLWMYLVGAPSSGKSTICELLSADEFNTRPLSKFTGLVSGHTQGQHLIPLLHNKCVIIKDGTLLLECTPVQLANVFGELRDIFDGSLEAHYRNGISASFSNISFGIIIGITEKIYGLNMSALGERFLHCRLETERETELARNRKAIENILGKTKRTMAEGEEEGDQRSFPRQRGYAAGFLSHLHYRVSNEEVIKPSYQLSDLELIQSLGDIISCSRAATTKDKNDQILYESRPESSTRSVKQLTRLALCLCYVLNVDSITDEVRHLLRKVALDTAHSRQYYVINALAKARSGLSREAIYQVTGIPPESCRRIILDLISLGIVNEDGKVANGLRGPNKKMLRLTPWIKEAFLYGKNHETDKVAEKTRPVSNGHPQKSFRKIEAAGPVT